MRKGVKMVIIIAIFFKIADFLWLVGAFLVWWRVVLLEEVAGSESVPVPRCSNQGLETLRRPNTADNTYPSETSIIFFVKKHVGV